MHNAVVFNIRGPSWRLREAQRTRDRHHPTRPKENPLTSPTPTKSTRRDAHFGERQSRLPVSANTPNKGSSPQASSVAPMPCYIPPWSTPEAWIPTFRASCRVPQGAPRACAGEARSGDLGAVGRRLIVGERLSWLLRPVQTLHRATSAARSRGVVP